MRTPREQFRNAVLEYLSPEAYSNRLSHSANMVTRDQANRTGSTPEKGYLQAGKQIDDLSKTRSDRVSKVQRGRRGGGNSRLNRKGFDDKRAVGQDKPRPATLNLGRTLDIADIEESNSQVGQRAQFDRKARLMRNRFGADVDPNAGSNVAAQARARTNQRMATKRFGQGAFASAGNTAAAQDASNRQMRQTSKRFQGRREQFKNAVLNYLNESEEAGRKLTQARQQGKLKSGKLSKEDYEAGHKTHPEALRRNIIKSVADKAGRKSSDQEAERLSKHQNIGGSVAMQHLTQGVNNSLKRDPSQGEGSDASKRTLDIAPMRSRRSRPQSGSMAQLDKHQKMARRRGKIAATQSTEDFHAGEEAAGATLNPKQASKAARSRTRTAAKAVRTAKHQAAQETGAKTTKSSKNPAIRKVIKAKGRDRRDRKNTYGDPKQGYKDSTDFDPMNPFDEQFKNAVLNYLDETSFELKPRSDEGRSKDVAKLAKERKRINDLQDDGYSHNTQPKSKVKPKHSFLARFKRLVQSPKKPK